MVGHLVVMLVPLFFFACERHIPHIEQALRCQLPIDRVLLNHYYLLMATAWANGDYQLAARR